MKKHIFLVGLLILTFASGSFFAELSAQIPDYIFIHSHNDYQRRVPFYQAYAQQLSSVEVDVFLKDGKLLVSHDPEELRKASTLDELYINPLVALFQKNENKAWKGSDKKLQLLVELKTPTDATMTALVETLTKYPKVFNPKVNPFAVQVVITGEYVPKPADFGKYPSYILYDGLISENYTKSQMRQVAYISVPFFEYADWNGKGTLKKADYKKVTTVIDKVHRMGKPIRFWGTPDHLTAWNTFYRMGVDIVNTDHPEKCADFFDRFGDKNYQIKGDPNIKVSGITKTDRLDKATAGFKGFDNEKIQLTKGTPIYMPTYRNDGADIRVKNIIFLIGDGMGLAQINMGETVNNGLTLLNFKHIGLQKNSSNDAYTTDSAAGGSSLATGEMVDNRHISASGSNMPYPSMTDFATNKGLSTGVVTLGNIADATPAAFYGHATERDYTDELTDWLLDSKLTLLNGAGMPALTDRKDGRNLAEELKTTYRVITSIEEINRADDKVICIDERMDQAATQETINLLADATREAIKKLEKTSDKGFFLMVEGAKIDYAGHSNSVPGSVNEMLSFDLAIAEALKFADSNGETLVIVTADHETGGLTLIDGDRSTGLITAYYVTDDHTPLMLPVFAYGPGAKKFMGVYQNTEIFKQMKRLLGL